MDELIIRGGLVIDGTGAPGHEADVAVSQGKITAIGDLRGRNAGKVLDARGLAVAPGFSMLMPIPIPPFCRIHPAHPSCIRGSPPR